ncbi:hypothetical protein ACFV3R_04735 [Streptomyces sp. NPDC059740]|uniref:hypothetical protein n=1 Tax=Streptomyces sp. NPDC059740 TaxID=3346926 RepID=UPI0036514FA6
MFRRRREPVPFAFVAEADRFRSNVAPPPRERASRAELGRRTLASLLVASGLAGALLLGGPALQPTGAGGVHQSQSEAANR